MFFGSTAALAHFLDGDAAVGARDGEDAFVEIHVGDGGFHYMGGDLAGLFDEILVVARLTAPPPWAAEREPPVPWPKATLSVSPLT